jgi:putative hydrolase of the HAD superfamily
VRALLLDLDDTLYAYAPCNEAGLAAAGLLLEAETGTGAGEFRALHDEVRSELAREHAGTAASHDRARFFERIVARAGGRPAPGLAVELHERYWAAFLARAEPGPDTHAVLAALAPRLPVVLVTNQLSAVQHAKVRRLGLEPYLTGVVTSEEAGADKPDPRIFRLALAAAGVEAGEALMVGDSLRGDVGGAVAAGIRALHTREFTGQRDEAGAALATLERLGELPGWIEGP